MMSIIFVNKNTPCTLVFKQEKYWVAYIVHKRAKYRDDMLKDVNERKSKVIIFLSL